MTHLGCLTCRVRFTAAPPARCTLCGGALSVLAPNEAMGFALATPPDLEWRPAEMDALARAVANVSASFRLH
jgi:hypothetical protein